MNHDPLCQTVRNTEMSEVFCDCEWIARVREDERGRAYGWPEYQSQRDRDVRAAALRDAVEAEK